MADLKPAESWLLQYRHVTPGGQPGKVEDHDNLTMDDLQAMLPEVLKHACYVYIQNNTVKFRGKTEKRG